MSADYYTYAELEWPERTILIGAVIRICIVVTADAPFTISSATYKVTCDDIQLVPLTPAEINAQQVSALVQVNQVGNYHVDFTFTIGDETFARRVKFRGIA